MGATYIELKGTFTFAINEQGFDYNNPEERQAAIDDFKKELEIALDQISNMNYVDIVCDETDIYVSDGEE